MKQRSLSSLAYVVFCCCLISSIAQGQRVAFEAYSSSRETITGQPFEVSFRLTNVRARKFDAPVFNGGLQAQGPSTSSSFANLNGISVISEIYSYYVVANKPGTYRIGAATVITTNGKSMRTKPITIKVKQAKKDANALQGKAFVRLEVNTNKAVVGEQVTLDYRIYTQVRIEQQQLLNYPSFDQAYVYDLNAYNSEGEIVEIEGEKYYTSSIRRIALFPSQAGKIIIEPIGMAIGVPAERAGPFSPYRLRQYKIYSDSVVIDVRQLDGAPTGFNGAIGQYAFQAFLNKATISSDEVIELTLRVQGIGNIKNVLSPALPINERYFDSFDPTIEEQLRVVNQLQGGIKTFSYILTPKALGEFTLQPRLVYFDGPERRFITLDTLLTIVVKEGKTPLPTKAERDTAQSAAAIVAAEEEEEALQYLAPVAITNLYPAPLKAFLGTSLFWVLLVLPLLLLVAFVYYNNYQAKRANQPLAERRRQAAGSEASRRLQQAQKALEANQPTAFYKEISTALLGFVSDRYQLSTVELNKQNVQQQLEQQEVDPAQIKQLLSILATSDRALFAGLADTASMKKIQQESKALIEQLQQ